MIIYDNFYAEITGNKITNVRTGIQTGNNYLSAGIFAPSISNNTVSAYVKGVYFNLQYGSASTFTVSGNTITQANATVSPVYNVGLLIQSIQSAVQAVIQGNNVSGFLYGVEFAGNDTTNTVTVQGGTLNDNTYGVWDTNNDYFYPANYNTTAALDDVAITNSTTAGVWVDSTSGNSSGQFNTTDTTTLAVTDGTSIKGGPVGLLVDGALSLASLQQSALSGNTTGVSIENGGALTSATQNFITGNTTGIAVASGAGTIGRIFDNDLSGNTTLAIANSSGVLIDASGNWWGSATSAGVQAEFSGLVDYTPFLVSGTDTDTATSGFQGDFSVLDVDAASAQDGTTGRIQEGVDDITAGGTVNVLAGTYAENVNIAKNLTLAGVAGNPTAAVVHPSTNAGDGVTIVAPATIVTVQDLEFTGANNGINASGLTTLNLSGLTLIGNTAGGTISNVNTVNETPSSGSTPTNVIATGLSFVSDLNQAVSISGILNFVVNGGSGSDTFNITPSVGTTFTVHGNNPTPPASPGDALTVPSGGTLTDTFSPGAGYSGTWTFAGANPVNFDGIETLTSSADLSISAVGPAAPVAGDPNGFNYTLTVTNNGPSDSTGGFTVTDTLPAGETFQAAGSTPGAGVSGQTITYTNSTGLANGATETFTIHVTVSADLASGTPLQDSAAVVLAAGATIDPNPNNNTSSSVNSTVATSADVVVTQTGPATVTAGTDATYTITTTNNGSSDALGVTTSDAAPVGTTFVSFVQNTGPANGGTLAAGESETFTLVVLVNSSDANSSTIVNTANVSTTTTDPNSANNTSTVNSVVATSADLVVTETGPATVIVGGDVTYTLIVTNNGPSDAQNVMLNVTLPAGETFVSASAGGGSGTSYSSGSLGTLAAGADLSVTVVAAVSRGAVGGSTLTNTATVSSSASDPNGANNTFSFSSTVEPQQPQVSVAFGPFGEVVEMVSSSGQLTQFDVFGAHQLGTGGVRSASVTFGPNGEVLEVVGFNGILTQFDASGHHQLGGMGVESATVAFGPGGEVLEVVLIDGSVRQFSNNGVQVLGTGGVASASITFGPGGAVVEILSTTGVLTQFTSTGPQQLGGAGVESVSVAFTSTGEVLDIIFSDGTTDQFDMFGLHRLGMVS